MVASAKDGCDPNGHPVLFCVVLKDRRARDGKSHAKIPTIVAYLCPLKTANFIPSLRPPRVPPPRPPHVQGTLKRFEPADSAVGKQQWLVTNLRRDNGWLLTIVGQWMRTEGMPLMTAV